MQSCRNFELRVISGVAHESGLQEDEFARQSVTVEM